MVEFILEHLSIFKWKWLLNRDTFLKGAAETTVRGIGLKTERVNLLNIYHVFLFSFFVLYIFSFSYILCNFLFNGYGIPNGKEI